MTLIAETKFTKFFTDGNGLQLECGGTLSPVTVAYQTYGQLNSERNNAILICHALTGNAHAAGVLNALESDLQNEFNLLLNYSKMNIGKTGWWDGIIGPGKAFDTEKYFVVCPNILGSCYGTTGPSSIIPETAESYNKNFPLITVRDMVNVQYELMKYLGVEKIKAIAGGSLGGMQVLEWGIIYPDFVEYLFPIATAAKNSAWAIALNYPAKQAIIKDPEFHGGAYKKQPASGLALARMMAMISYRSDVSYEDKFGRQQMEEMKKLDMNNMFAMQSYLEYQGNKLVDRFDANTYLCVTNATDMHDVSRGRGSIEDALGAIKARTLTIGVSSDMLYPVREQHEIARCVPNGKYSEITSLLGHDAFLIEFKQLDNLINNFMK